MRVAGVMSGTSLDGTDVAIVDITDHAIRPVYFRSTPYPELMRQEILAISNTTTHTAALSRLNVQLGRRFGRAVVDAAKRAKIPLESIQLIGSHGQTIYHESWNTLQIGDAASIAWITGVPVISNFRAADMAAGGQGAPLVAFFDYRMFRHPERRRIALNIGGIANVTIIPPGAGIEKVKAFDTGPGNMVMDQLMSEYTNGRESFDRGGKVAASAQPDLDLLRALLDDPYYTKKPPKSTGREKYGREFIAMLKQSGQPIPVLIATAALLTASSIALSVGNRPADLIVSGGGAQNPYLIKHLRALLPRVDIASSGHYGVNADAKEAIAFALMAYETWHGRPSNVPSATGAREPVILGQLTR